MRRFLLFAFDWSEGVLLVLVLVLVLVNEESKWKSRLYLYFFIDLLDDISANLKP